MDQEILNKDLQSDLKRFMRLHKLSSIRAVRKIPVADLLKMPGFSYRLLLEFVLNKTAS